MKRKPTPSNNPFNFKKGQTEIKGDSNQKSLIVLCYLRELRWLLWLIAVYILHYLSG